MPYLKRARYALHGNGAVDTSSTQVTVDVVGKGIPDKQQRYSMNEYQSLLGFMGTTNLIEECH